MRREYPDLVTLEPALDDEEIFGDAWPLVVEWRELKDDPPQRGQGALSGWRWRSVCSWWSSCCSKSMG